MAGADEDVGRGVAAGRPRPARPRAARRWPRGSSAARSAARSAPRGASIETGVDRGIDEAERAAARSIARAPRSPCRRRRASPSTMTVSPCSQAFSRTPSRPMAVQGSVEISSQTKPMVEAAAADRARRRGAPADSRAGPPPCITRSRVSAERRAPSAWLRTSETVVCETRASLATSIIVGRRGGGRRRAQFGACRLVPRRLRRRAMRRLPPASLPHSALRILLAN